jgi:hypothetical protein
LVANPIVIEKGFGHHLFSILNLVVIEKYFDCHPMIGLFKWRPKPIFGCHTLSDQKFLITNSLTIETSFDHQ